MSTTFAFYADAGLTTLATGGAAIASIGSTADRVLRFGSPATDKTLQAASNPGTDPITITPTDGAPGSGIEASAIRLALSAAGLDSATPGAALNIGTTLNSGTAGAVTVYVRTARGSLGIGNYADLSLVTNAVVEA